MDIETLFKKLEERRIIIDNHPGRWVLWSDVEKIFDKLKTEVVKIPQDVADWIEYCKKIDYTLYRSMNLLRNYADNGVEKFSGKIPEIFEWVRENSETYARAWIEGYEVEEEKHYLVKLKATNQYLHVDNFSKPSFSSQFTSELTKTMLDNLGLSEVFSNPLFEVEEVE